LHENNGIHSKAEKHSAYGWRVVKYLKNIALRMSLCFS
jgi:hypothetical protein